MFDYNYYCNRAAGQVVNSAKQMTENLFYSFTVNKLCISVQSFPLKPLQMCEAKLSRQLGKAFLSLIV